MPNPQQLADRVTLIEELESYIADTIRMVGKENNFHLLLAQFEIMKGRMLAERELGDSHGV